MPAGVTLQIRRDTAANWAAANPVLAQAEPGLETDTNLIKYGNGVTPWNSLPYAGGNPDVSTNLVPTVDGVYNLGSPTHRWNELYLTGNTIYLGTMTLSEQNGQFYVEGPGWELDVSLTMADRGADGPDWNLLTIMGVYTVSRTSWAGVNNAPLDCMIFKGVLQVSNTTNGVDTSITQQFFPGEQQAEVTTQFIRSYWNGVWTAWYKIVNNDQTVSGGEF